MTGQEIFTMLFQLLLTGGLGIITYFLKRVIDEVDKNKSDIGVIKTTYVQKSDFDEVKNEVTKVKENYLTKDDFYREQLKTEQKLDKIMDILMEMKGDR